MNRHVWMSIAAILMGLAVALGAFAAHGLKSVLSQTMLDIWHTAVTYQAWHALGLMVLASQMDRLPKLNLAAGFMLAGIILFSGSLYTLALSGIGWFGAITPFGGSALLIAWSIAAWQLVKAQD